MNREDKKNIYGRIYVTILLFISFFIFIFYLHDEVIRVIPQYSDNLNLFIYFLFVVAFLLGSLNFLFIFFLWVKTNKKRGGFVG